MWDNLLNKKPILNYIIYAKFVRSRQPGIIPVMFRLLLWFY